MTKQKKSLNVTLVPKGITLGCYVGETIYEAAKRQGIVFTVGCKNGNCHICEGQLLSGTVLEGASRVHRKPDDLSVDGTEKSIMLCRAKPQSDCIIEMNDVLAPGELPLKTVSCQVIKITQLPAQVYLVSLLLPAGKQVAFYPGQYLSLMIPGRDDPAYFSIASKPGQRELELHIQAAPENESAMEVINFVQQQSTLKLTLPYGKACLSEHTDRPLVLMAAGTGFAQMKSIIEHSLSENAARDITLYWTVRKEQDMYMKSLAESWLDKCEHFDFVPVVANKTLAAPEGVEAEEQENVDHHEVLCQKVLAHHHDLKNSLVYVSGSPRLVFTARDALMAAGLPEPQFFSDVLEYQSKP